MSCCVMCDGRRCALQLDPAKEKFKGTVFLQSGITMLEHLVALLVFSMAMMGLMSAQLAAKKVVYEAGQRSVATALGRDIVERMRTNVGQLDDYRAMALGDVAQLLSRPNTDCNVSICTATQLAMFDLWQWELQLLGLSEHRNGASSGGLVSPRACIASDGGEVTVSISWLASSVVLLATPSICGADDIGSGATLGEFNDGNLQRQQLMIATYIGSR